MERHQGLATGIPARLSPRELKRFAITLAVPFSILAALSAWRGHTILAMLFTVLAAILVALTLLAPGFLGPIHRVWMGTANALGWFNTRLILGLVYFLVITPTGLLMRLIRRDPLQRRLHNQKSYWVARPQGPLDQSTMEHQF